jgi:hypothetical protein
MTLTDYHDMIKALPADRADESFHVSIIRYVGGGAQMFG